MTPEKKKTSRKQRMVILLAPAAAHKPDGRSGGAVIESAITE
jgi:hypothetical protein